MKTKTKSALAPTGKKEIKKVRLPMMRMSFPKLKDPDENNRYGCVGIYDPKKATDLDKERFAAAQQLLEDTKDARWPQKAGIWAGFKSAVRKGKSENFDLDKYPEYKGCYIISMGSKGRPVGFVDRNKQPITDWSKVYPGCYFDAFVTAFAFDVDKSKGVSFGIQSGMVIKDGPPLMNVSKPEDDYAEVDVDDEYGAEDNEAFEEELDF